MTMNIDPQQVRAIFLTAVENHPPDHWPAYLDKACGSNPDLRRRVEVLLRAHKQDNSLFDTPVAVTVDEPRPRHNDRPLQAPGADRRRRFRRRLHGRAAKTT